MQLDQIFTGAFEWLSGPLGTGLAIFMLIFGGLTFWAFSNVAIWDDAEDNIGNEAFWVSMVVFVPFIGIPLYALVRLLLVLHTIVTDLCDQGYRKFIGGNKLVRFSPVGTPMKQQLRYTIYRQAGGGVNTNTRPDLMKGPRTIGSTRPDPEHKPFTATIAGEKGDLLRETKARASRGEPLEIAVINHNFMPKDAAATRSRAGSGSSPFEVSRREHQKMSWRAKMRELRSERFGQASRPSA
ncbi:MAG: hypothetical protein H7A35_02165 [Planctomycetales bacterium]|nr:hypothetical protein [bacterium]UNM08864.1 MAG: hypothetical protein H7A35_02165 [Planctomycetales bacterium]